MLNTFAMFYKSWEYTMESHFGQRSSFSRTVENFLGRSRIFSDSRDLSRTVEIFLGQSRIFSDGREFSRTVENFLGRSRFFTDGRDFSRTVEIFLGRSRFFSDGREFSRTVEILNFSRSVEIFSRTLQLFLQFDYVAEKLRISGTVLLVSSNSLHDICSHFIPC